MSVTIRLIEAQLSPLDGLNRALNLTIGPLGSTGYGVQNHEITYPEYEEADSEARVPPGDRFLGLTHTINLVIKGRDKHHLSLLVSNLSRRLTKAIDWHHSWPTYLQIVDSEALLPYSSCLIRDYTLRYTSDSYASGIHVAREGILVLKTSLFTNLMRFDNRLYKRVENGSLDRALPIDISTFYRTNVSGYTYGEPAIAYATLSNCRRPGGTNIMRAASGDADNPTLEDNSLPFGAFTAPYLVQPDLSPFYLYISSAHADGQGPFSTIEFDFDDAIYNTAHSFERFQYWDGAAWADLLRSAFITIHGKFTATGRNIVSFPTPKKWDYGTPPGTSAPGWWIRLRISAGQAQAAVQRNQKAFTPFLPFIDIPAIASDEDIPVHIRLSTISPTRATWNTMMIASTPHDEFPLRDFGNHHYPVDGFYNFSDRGESSSLNASHNFIGCTESQYSQFVYSGNAPSGRVLEVAGSQFEEIGSTLITMKQTVNPAGSISFYLPPKSYRVFLRYMAHVDLGEVEVVEGSDPPEEIPPVVGVSGYFISTTNYAAGNIEGNATYMREVFSLPSVGTTEQLPSGMLPGIDQRDHIFVADLGAFNIDGQGNKARSITFVPLFSFSQTSCNLRLYDLVLLPVDRTPLLLVGGQIAGIDNSTGRVPQEGAGVSIWPEGRGYRAQVEGGGIEEDILSSYSAVGTQALRLKPNVANRIYFFAYSRPSVRNQRAPGVSAGFAIGAAPWNTGQENSDMDMSFAVEVTPDPGFLLPK